MSTPVAGSLATVPLHVAAGDIAVWWNDPGGTWESVPLGSGPAGPQGVPGPTGATGAQGPAGEYVDAVNNTGTTLPAGTTTTIAMISLTAGDWDVSGEVWVNQTNASQIKAGINTVAATFAPLPAQGVSTSAAYPTVGAAESTPMALAPCRISVAATTSVYLCAAQTGGTGGAGYGKISARRAR